jgi:uncharacterized protein YndB with AHSA1/START domain
METMTMTLPHVLDRTILIEAPQEVVFSYFTDDARWAAWWGAGSTIDPRPGGRVYIRYPGNVEVAGEVIETAPPDRIVFTYGFVSGKPIPPGSSRVTIRLEPVATGTRLRLEHAFAEAEPRDHHVQGWRYQLSVFANVVADELHREAARTVDAWFALWSETDEEARRRSLTQIASSTVRMRDRYSCVEGVDELTTHIGAAQRFMPRMQLERLGTVRQCQGTVLADWKAVGADGQPRGSGTNVFVLDAAGRIASVTGFWSPPA